VSTCALVTPPLPLPPLPIHHDGGTLDELVTALWEGLRADQSAACPVCGAEMKPDYGVHARAIGGSCASCGSSLY
jgi:hypothetical protein